MSMLEYRNQILIIDQGVSTCGRSCDASINPIIHTIVRLSPIQQAYPLLF